MNELTPETEALMDALYPTEAVIIRSVVRQVLTDSRFLKAQGLYTEEEYSNLKRQMNTVVHTLRTVKGIVDNTLSPITPKTN